MILIVWAECPFAVTKNLLKFNNLNNQKLCDRGPKLINFSIDCNLSVFWENMTVNVCDTAGIGSIETARFGLEA